MTGGSEGNGFTVSDGIDIVNGGFGDDDLAISYGLATLGITGGITGAGTLDGFRGVFTGGAGRSVTFDNIDGLSIATGSGNDSISGSSAADFLTVNGGTDFVDGRGHDGSGDHLTVDYAAATTAVIGGVTGVGSLGRGHQGSFTDGVGRTVTFDNIERVSVRTGGGNDNVGGGTGLFNIFSTGAGDDIINFIPGAISDNGDGGRGIDRAVIDFSEATSAVNTTSFGGYFVHGHTARYSTVSRSVSVLSTENFTITGGSAGDTLRTGDGEDVLDGGGGDDTLISAGGADRFDGGAGADALTGGAGDDRFIARAGMGADRVTDFVAGANTDDRVDTRAFPGIATFSDVMALATQSGAHTVIDFGGGDMLTLENVARSSLVAEDFLLSNEAPVNSVPGTRAFDANVPAAITGLSVADDSGAGVITTRLSLQYGILTLAAMGGAAIVGNGTDQVTLNGTLAEINAALAGNNVIYSSPADFFGTDTLTMMTNDNGHTGPGAPLTDTDQVTIHLNTYQEGTDGDDSFHALPGNEFIVARLGHDTVAFDFALTAATVTWRNNLVIIDGPSSHTVLSGFETYEFTDGTVQNADGDRLVDDLFYYSRNHDLWNAGVDADAHYHATGWREGRDPNAFFDTDLYLAISPDVRNAGTDPLVHFDQSGWREGRVASPNFDPAKYLAFYTDVAAANRDPLEHFLRHGAEENRLPFAASVPLAANGFDFAYYLLHNPDVAAAGVDPRVHFETIGWREGRNPNALFDVNGYLAHYSDVANAGINPLDHYHQSGWREGRDPSVELRQRLISRQLSGRGGGQPRPARALPAVRHPRGPLDLRGRRLGITARNPSCSGRRPIRTRRSPQQAGRGNK